MEPLNDTQPYFDPLWRTLGSPVDESVAGQRIDHFLAKNYPFLTRSGWQKRLDGGEVLINRIPVKSSYRVRPLDVVYYHHPVEAEPEVDGAIQVLWEEGGVLAVFKPGNLPMHENGPYRKNTFAYILGEMFGKEWSAVHRLDRETSGIVLCAATHDLRKKLSDDFLSRRIAKEYQLIVDGVPTQDQWTVDGPIGDLTTSQIRIKKWVVPGGLEARTDFVVEQTAREAAILRAYPKTGRTNQIRIHSAYSGHWIIGDKLYHPDETVFLDYWESQKTTDYCVQQTKFHRCCLHAAALAFTHPETGKLVRVESDLPEDMKIFWGRFALGS